MLHQETLIRTPASDADERVSVSMRTEGVELVLFFADLSGEGDVLEVRVLPDTSAVTPAAVAKIGSAFPLYLGYARAAITWDRGEVRDALAALRSVGKTKRGLPPDFYRAVAKQYDALVAEGEPYPVKAIGLLNSVTISAASRWVTEARRRRLLSDQIG